MTRDTKGEELLLLALEQIGRAIGRDASRHDAIAALRAHYASSAEPTKLQEPTNHAACDDAIAELKRKARKLRVELQNAASPARCRFWCGNRWEEEPGSCIGTVFLQRWCSNACRTAGRPLGDGVLSPESTEVAMDDWQCGFVPNGFDYAPCSRSRGHLGPHDMKPVRTEQRRLVPCTQDGRGYPCDEEVCIVLRRSESPESTGGGK